MGLSDWLRRTPDLREWNLLRVVDEHSHAQCQCKNSGDCNQLMDVDGWSLMLVHSDALLNEGG